MAALLLDDVDEVCRVVSDAITAAVEADAGLDADPFLARQRLTASVRQRCHGRLATRERFR